EVERAALTVFVPVAGRDAGTVPPEGRIRLTEIPAIDAAVAVHEGDPGDIDRTYAALGEVVAERAIGVDGPIREYYLSGIPTESGTPPPRTEVCWPVFRTAPA